MLNAVDFAQSVLIIISAVFIVKYMKKLMREQTIQLRTLSQEMKSLQSLQTQTRILAICYLAFVISDFIMMATGNALFSEKEDFACYDRVAIYPLNNGGAAFLLVYSVLLLLFSLMVWGVFYKVPESFGLIAKPLTDSVHLRETMFNNTNSITDEVIEDIKSMNNNEEMMTSMVSPMYMRHRNSNDIGMASPGGFNKRYNSYMPQLPPNYRWDSISP